MTEKTEILFWKVFKNDFIFKEIFNQIHNNQWIEYDNPNKYSVYNRYEDYLEIIELLIKHRRDEFEITDLINIATNKNSPDVIRLLVNEPYSVIIYPTAFYFIIKSKKKEINFKINCFFFFY
ncbi:hypothetical protein DDB_G0277623 [Dictyostelium discoideum AX4]|uniref:Uncharacterized protein n=1 Tax=Dictyostelium discoideum TaxID=44689 RepID=Q54ZE5_DICDI|nr:hypothetical protein DDB_G0277623 [Dictyostelium discoideum AX4]EAL68629.1 hypothetical protein DDB_G0277623 [Dictyostelium discoideum AX4]|eukprot:XP_642552.1 hypothetical protein DDB_G0277623 [Dictyostelium discoideum AX4]